jgi:hypothetical protein
MVMTMEQKIAAFLDAIGEVVSAEGSWQEKKNRILEEATEDQKTNLYEFIAWFD